MSNYWGFSADPLQVQYGGLLFRLILTPDRTLLRYLRKKTLNPSPSKKLLVVSTLGAVWRSVIQIYFRQRIEPSLDITKIVLFLESI